MAERSAISTVAQIGVETTSGTAVAADKLLAALMIAPSIKSEVDEIGPQGYIFDTALALNREWCEADLSGYPTYEELTYLLSSLILATTSSASGTTGHKWTFAPTSTGGDTVKTYTVESGSASRAGKFAYGLVDSLTLKWGRSGGVDLKGKMIGQRYTDGITMTASPTAVALTPITPGEIDIYLDTTYGGLGGTKLTKVRQAEWTFDGRWSPAWYLNTASTSFGGHTEIKPKSSLKIKATADSTSMGWLTNLRAGDTLFARIQGTGPQIGAGPAVNSLKADMALQVHNVGKFEDDGGLYAIEWDFGVVHNAGWGKALSIELINSLSTL
jgi:hypothetical protein